jgi:hypothetical protein
VCKDEPTEKDTLDARGRVVELVKFLDQPLLAEGAAAGGVPLFRVGLRLRARHRGGAAWLSSLADTLKP